MSFATRLKSARELKGLNQKELSLKIGKSQNVVSNYEAGTSYPNIETLYKILEILEVEPNILFWDDLSDNLQNKIMNTQNRDLTVALYQKLDITDKSEIKGEIKQMLKAEKYTKPDATEKKVSLSDIGNLVAEGGDETFHRPKKKKPHTTL